MHLKFKSFKCTVGWILTCMWIIHHNQGYYLGIFPSPHPSKFLVPLKHLIFFYVWPWANTHLLSVMIILLVLEFYMRKTNKNYLIIIYNYKIIILYKLNQICVLCLACFDLYYVFIIHFCQFIFWYYSFFIMHEAISFMNVSRFLIILIWWIFRLVLVFRLFIVLPTMNETAEELFWINTFEWDCWGVWLVCIDMLNFMRN